MQLREQEKLAKKHITALNPEKLHIGAFKQKQSSMKRRIAELEAQASAAAEVISIYNPFVVNTTCKRENFPMQNLLCNMQVSNSMKSLQAELAELKKRLEGAEHDLRTKHQEVEDLKVGPCHSGALVRGSASAANLSQLRALQAISGPTHHS